MNCNGFSTSSARTKHYKKHVLGKGGGTGWVADMYQCFTSAIAYEAAAIEFATRVGTFHAVNFPIVELETAKGNIARWNQETGFFAACTPHGVLITFHIRSCASAFQRSILEF